jgi:hypothetical protein
VILPLARRSVGAPTTCLAHVSARMTSTSLFYRLSYGRMLCSARYPARSPGETDKDRNLLGGRPYGIGRKSRVENACVLGMDYEVP